MNLFALCRLGLSKMRNMQKYSHILLKVVSSSAIEGVETG
jgi:hypothetical protein